MAAPKRVSQETFDDIVRENIDEFSMSREAAVDDAVAQLTASGVDLSNIVRSAGIQIHPVLNAAAVLKCNVVSADASYLVQHHEIASALEALDAEVASHPVEARAIACTNNVIKHLTLLVAGTCHACFHESAGDKREGGRAPACLLLLAGLRSLRVLCTEHVENRSLIAVGFSEVLLAALHGADPERAFAESGVDADDSTAALAGARWLADVQCAVLYLAALLCVKREGFKVALFNRGAPQAIAHNLQWATSAAAAHAAHTASAAAAAAAGRVVTASCALLTRMLTDDDMSIEASKAYNHARLVATTASAAAVAGTSAASVGAASSRSTPTAAAPSPTPSVASSSASGASVVSAKERDLQGLALVAKLLAALRVFADDHVVAPELMAGLKVVTVNDDICKEIDRRGGVVLITACLVPCLQHPYVAPPPPPPEADAAVRLSTGADGAGAAGGVGLAAVAEGEEGEGEEGAGEEAARGTEPRTPPPTPVPDALVAPTTAPSATAFADAMRGAAAAAATGAGARTAAAAVAAPADAAAVAASARRARMLRCGLSVLKAVAGSDAVKTRMCDPDTFSAAAPARASAAIAPVAAATAVDAPASGTGNGGGGGVTSLQVAVAALEAYSACAPVAEAAAAAIASLCLRLPAHADVVCAAGGMDMLAAAMRRHPGAAGLQRACCLATRNMVVRGPARAAAAFAAGLEPLLQAAYARHPQSRDVVYAALRDMGCGYAVTEVGHAAAERAARAIAAGDISVR